MKMKALTTLTAASLLAATTGGVHAQTVSDTMTNIATVADACDVVAVGVDFGIVPLPIPPTGVPGVLPNVAAGVTGHPNAGADGADSLSLLGIAVPFTSAPGVYVACTMAPISIGMSGANGGSLPLPVALGPATGPFSGKMAGTGGSIDYTMTMVGAAVSTTGLGLPVGAYVAAFTGVNLIPAAQTGTFGAGFYTDTVTVTVNY